MIRHDQPALLITSEDTATADAIRKGEWALGGRLNSDPQSNGLQYALQHEARVTGFEKGRMCFADAKAPPFAAKGKKKVIAKAFCEHFDLKKAAKLFGKEEEVMAMMPSYEPGKESYENMIKWKLDQLGELQSSVYQVERICREDKSFDKVKGVLESAYARLQTEIKACADKHSSAKKSMEPPSLTKAIFVLTGMDHYDQARPENELLKDTHGEQFSSDADKMVVNYLTTVEKINLESSPAHNPWGQPAFHGYPQVQKAESVVGEGHVPMSRPVDGKKKKNDKVCKALDDLCKGDFASLATPMTNSIPKKAKVTTSVPKVSSVKAPKMAPVALKSPKALSSAQPVKAPKAGAKLGGKGMTAKSEKDTDLYVMAFA